MDISDTFRRATSVERDPQVRQHLDNSWQSFLTSHLNTKLEVLQHSNSPPKWLSEDELYRRACSPAYPVLTPTDSSSGTGVSSPTVRTTDFSLTDSTTQSSKQSSTSPPYHSNFATPPRFEIKHEAATAASPDCGTEVGRASRAEKRSTPFDRSRRYRTHKMETRSSKRRLRSRTHRSRQQGRGP